MGRLGEEQMSLEIKADNTDLVVKGINDAVLRALERIGQAAEGYAKDLCPTGTPQSTGIPGYIGGTLKNSITHALSGEAAAISSYTDNAGKVKGSYSGLAPEGTTPSVYIGSNVDYAIPVETGTRRMKAQPFLKPAIADHSKTYRNILEDELKNG